MRSISRRFSIVSLMFSHLCSVPRQRNFKCSHTALSVSETDKPYLRVTFMMSCRTHLQRRLRCSSNLCKLDTPGNTSRLVSKPNLTNLMQMRKSTKKRCFGASQQQFKSTLFIGLNDVSLDFLKSIVARMAQTESSHHLLVSDFAHQRFACKKCPCAAYGHPGQNCE